MTVCERVAGQQRPDLGSSVHAATVKLLNVTEEEVAIPELAAA